MFVENVLKDSPKLLSVISTTETIILDDGVVIEFSPGFLIFAIFLCFSISLLGTICNTFLLIKFAMRNEKANGFQKTCLVKTIPNIIICITFLFWIVPIITFNYSFEEVPYWLNSFMGSLAGVWAYFLTPLLQISMSCNRFYVLYFPFGIKSFSKIPTANIYIFFALICVTFLTFFIFSKGCGYVFYPEYFQLIQEDLECTDNLMKQTMYFIFGFTVVSNSFNVATAARLLMSKMVGISQRDSTKRRRRWMVLFVQSVLQDCLHLIDIINAYFMWKLSEELWFQFFFLTLSFVLIYTLDGFVMLAFNKDVRPKCCSKVEVVPKNQRRSTLTTT